MWYAFVIEGFYGGLGYFPDFLVITIFPQKINLTFYRSYDKVFGNGGFMYNISLNSRFIALPELLYLYSHNALSVIPATNTVSFCVDDISWVDLNRALNLALPNWLIVADIEFEPLEVEFVSRAKILSEDIGGLKFARQYTANSWESNFDSFCTIKGFAALFRYLRKIRKTEIENDLKDDLMKYFLQYLQEPIINDGNATRIICAFYFLNFINSNKTLLSSNDVISHAYDIYTNTQQRLLKTPDYKILGEASLIRKGRLYNNF